LLGRGDFLAAVWAQARWVIAFSARGSHTSAKVVCFRHDRLLAGLSLPQAPNLFPLFFVLDLPNSLLYSPADLPGHFGLNINPYTRRCVMANSTYKIIELVGSSTKSWEDAAKSAVETAAKSVKELRIAEVTKMDMTIENGKVTSYRARITVSFKYVRGD
jgi:flavin-binding protein dodecin